MDAWERRQLVEGNEALFQRIVMDDLDCKSSVLSYFHSGDPRRDRMPGFPDLVIVGPGGILFVELKSQDGRMTSVQLGWKSAIQDAGGEWALWRPEDWENGVIDDALAWLMKPAEIPWLTPWGPGKGPT